MPDLSVLLLRALKSLSLGENTMERTVQMKLLDALEQMRGVVSSFYEKYARNGVISLTELTKSGKYKELENRITGLLEPALTKGVKGIHNFLPIQYEEAFLRTTWALDTSLGVHLGLKVPSSSEIASIFDSNNPQNIYVSEALFNFPIEARKNTRKALMNGIYMGKSMNSMYKDLGTAVSMAYSKTKLIVGTENTGAINHGIEEAFKRALENGVSGKIIWSTRNDDKVRPASKYEKGDHREMEGQVRDEEGLFHLHRTGETAPFPGWQGLSPEQRINCRCRQILIVDGYDPTKNKGDTEKIDKFMGFETWRQKYYGGK